MDKTIRNWICNNAVCNYKWRNFCSSVAVVYRGIKPAEIINATHKQYENCYVLRNCINLRIIREKTDSIHLFIYNSKALEKTLNNKYVKEQLRSLGYGSELDINTYVDHLIDRLITSSDFPHEIGFFLGYPIKDVLGFMNVINLPHTKTMGWRMYGNTRLSENVYLKVKEAKKEIHDFVMNIQSSA